MLQKILFEKVLIISTLIINTLASLSMLGADVSSLQRSEELGQKYYNAKGQQEDALDILKSIGVNYIRLRIWNNPLSKTNTKEKVLEYAKHVKAKGFKLMIDFHYSDVWADPPNQHKPIEWSKHDLSQLQKDVYFYTRDVCLGLKSQGTVPDSVQIGNEINIGINAIKDCNKDTKIIIHTAYANNDGAARWFYDGIKSVGVQWDITGLSYYCFVHGSIQNMQEVVKDMKSRYNKDVIIAETSYVFEGMPPWDGHLCSGYPPTPTGQANNFRDVQSAARNAGAVGVFYWEPTWLNIKGNGWDPNNINGTSSPWANQAVFDNMGHLNTAIKWET